MEVDDTDEIEVTDTNPQENDNFFNPENQQLTNHTKEPEYKKHSNFSHSSTSSNSQFNYNQTQEENNYQFQDKNQSITFKTRQRSRSIEENSRYKEKKNRNSSPHPESPKKIKAEKKELKKKSKKNSQPFTKLLSLKRKKNSPPKITVPEKTNILAFQKFCNFKLLAGIQSSIIEPNGTLQQTIDSSFVKLRAYSEHLADLKDRCAFYCKSISQSMKSQNSISKNLQEICQVEWNELNENMEIYQLNLNQTSKVTAGVFKNFKKIIGQFPEYHISSQCEGFLKYEESLKNLKQEYTFLVQELYSIFDTNQEKNSKSTVVLVNKILKAQYDYESLFNHCLKQVTPYCKLYDKFLTNLFKEIRKIQSVYFGIDEETASYFSLRALLDLNSKTKKTKVTQLTEMLSHPGWFDSLIEFAKVKMCEENLYFWKECQEYKAISPKNRNGLQKKFTEIVENYIVEGSKREINLDAASRKEVQRLWFSGTTTGFHFLTPETLKETENGILEMIEAAVLSPFLTSDVYKETEHKIKEESRSKRSTISGNPSLEFLLNNPIGLSYFRRFLQETSQMDFLNFWMEVDELQNLQFFDLEFATKIYKTYLQDVAPFELISIDENIRQKLGEELRAERDLNPELFLDCQTEVFNVLQNAYCEEFIGSKHCKDLIDIWKNTKKVQPQKKEYKNYLNLPTTKEEKAEKEQMLKTTFFI